MTAPARALHTYSRNRQNPLPGPTTPNFNQLKKKILKIQAEILPHPAFQRNLTRLRKIQNINPLISIHAVAVTEKKDIPLLRRLWDLFSSDKHQNSALMFAASRPDESITGGVGRKGKREEEKKTELSGEWFPVK